MNTYTLFWDNGEKELIKADTIKEAQSIIDYKSSSKCLNFYEDGNEMDNYEWNNDLEVWVPRKLTKEEIKTMYDYLDILKSNDEEYYEMSKKLEDKYNLECWEAEEIIDNWEEERNT